MAESSDLPETRLATKVVETLSASPSTTIATLATRVEGRRRQNKVKLKLKFSTTIRANSTGCCLSGLST
jgi:hypothetical protein